MNLDKYLTELDQNTNKLISQISEYSKGTLESKSEHGWSVMEILEHLFLTDEYVYNLLSQPSSQKAKSGKIIGHKFLMKELMVGNKIILSKSPDNLSPRGSFENLSAFIFAYALIRKKITQDLTSQTIVFDNRTYRHPILGNLTVADWLYFIMYHTDRHMLQINNIIQNTCPQLSH